MKDEFDENIAGDEESVADVSINASDPDLYVGDRDSQGQVGEQRKIPEMTLKEYIEIKYKQYLQSGLDENSWKMLRSQINSGVALGISLDRIEIYAKITLDYAQREVLKYALYEGVEDEFVKELAESGVSAEVLRVKLDDKKVNVKMTEELSTPLQILSDSISAYKQDIDKYKEQADKEINKYKEKLEVAENETRILKEKLEFEKKSSEEQRQIIREKEKRERERKDFEERVEKAAQEKFAKMQLEEAANRERKEYERQMIEKEIRKEGKSKHSFWRKKEKISCDKPRKNIPQPYVQPLPAGFDLTAYIMSAGLSSDQMDVLSLAVRSRVDDSIIKAMIDQQLPAAQMKQLLVVILAREHQGSAMKEDDVVYIDQDE